MVLDPLILTGLALKSSGSGWGSFYCTNVDTAVTSIT